MRTEKLMRTQRLMRTERDEVRVVDEDRAVDSDGYKECLLDVLCGDDGTTCSMGG